MQNNHPAAETHSLHHNGSSQQLSDNRENRNHHSSGEHRLHRDQYDQKENISLSQEMRKGRMLITVSQNLNRQSDVRMEEVKEETDDREDKRKDKHSNNSNNDRKTQKYEFHKKRKKKEEKEKS